MASTHKKVIVRKMGRDSAGGYVSPNFIVEGKLEKFYQTYCLVDQGFVKKNSEISVKEHVATVAKQLGDEIAIRRFVRFQVGEAPAA